MPSSSITPDMTMCISLIEVDFDEILQSAPIHRRPEIRKLPFHKRGTLTISRKSIQKVPIDKKVRRAASICYLGRLKHVSL
jgi:hypothetical protein